MLETSSKGGALRTMKRPWPELTPPRLLLLALIATEGRRSFSRGASDS